MVRSSAFCPACQPPNPQEEVWVKCVRPAASNASCAMTSAMGERQILPVQTKQICKGCEDWEDDEVKATDIWLCLPALLQKKQLEVAYSSKHGFDYNGLKASRQIGADLYFDNGYN